MKKILGVAVALAVLVPGLGLGQDAAVVTQVTVRVGIPAEPGGGPTVELIPGTVISLDPSASPASRVGTSWILDHVALDERLAETFRIRMDSGAGAGTAKLLEPGMSTELEPAGGAVRVRVELTQLQGDLASYVVHFLEDGRELSRTPVSVRVGSRAVVGARDGEPAPYLFVILEPVRPGPDTPVHFVKGSDFTAPKVVKAVQPAYPETAREEGVEGVVVLAVVIRKDGSVGRVSVVKSPDERLTAAAETAVREWHFEPARGAGGNPVAVEYTLTMAFRLN